VAAVPDPIHTAIITERGADPALRHLGHRDMVRLQGFVGHFVGHTIRDMLDVRAWLSLTDL
jgi:hypothetical protein